MLNIIRNLPRPGARAATLGVALLIPLATAATAGAATVATPTADTHIVSVTALPASECASLAKAHGQASTRTCEVRITTSVSPGVVRPDSSQTFYEYANACFDDGAVLNASDNAAGCGMGEITVAANVTVNWANGHMSTPWEQCTQKATSIAGIGWSLSDPTWCAYTGNGTQNFTVGGNWDASNLDGSGTAALRIDNTYISEGGVSLVHENATAYWNGV